MSTSNKRQSVNFDLKKKVLDEYEKNKNVTQKDLASQMGIKRQTLQNIVKKKVSTLKAIEDGNEAKRARLRTGKYNSLEAALIEWFKQVRNENIAVSGDLFKPKALEIAEKLGIIGFVASNGWMEKCQRRFGIKFKTEQGESGAVDVESLLEWQKKVLLEEIAKFSPDDVFNADETGLFWQLLPNKTMAFKGDKCSGGKKSKERITVLVGANMSGTHKLPLLVIGKSAKPHCFKQNKIPVDYKANKKAWMTSDLFEEWLKGIDKRMKKEDRHVLLYLDNCSSHTVKLSLSNLTVKFLPPNTTSKSQPMDQGIIKNLKVNYRRLLLRNRIKAIEEKREYKLNVLNALHFVQRAWDEVKAETVKNCFRHAGFVARQETEEPMEIEPVNTSDEAMDSLLQAWNNLQVSGEIDEDITLEDYVDVDDDVLTGGAFTINEILEKYAPAIGELESEDEPEIEVKVEEPPISSLEAQRAYRIVSQYVEQNFNDPAILRHSYALDDALYDDRTDRNRT